MKKLLEMLGFGKRQSWQELVGLRPHMIDPDAADAGYGKRRTYAVQDRIALIEVRGILVNDEDWWDGYGFSTYNRITEELRGALEDPNVDGILLRVNSPGGECDNAFETATEIVAADKRKPVWAVAETAAYSGGYLLAASGSRLYVPPFTGGVGSIGVYSVHMDWSAYLEGAGIKPTFFEAGKGKTDGHPYQPLSAAAKARLQAEVDRLYGMFVDHVAARRGVPAGTIRELGAVLLPGASAIDQGLADKIGNSMTALADMRAYLDSRAAAAMAGGQASAPAQAPAAERPAPPPAASAEAPAPGEQPQESPAADASSSAASAPEGREDDPVVASREARANHARIEALCRVAGRAPEAAAAYIAAGRTPDQVAEELLAARAAASEQNSIVSQLQPQTAAGAGAANVNESAIVKAAERIAQARR